MFQRSLSCCLLIIGFIQPGSGGIYPLSFTLVRALDPDLTEGPGKIYNAFDLSMTNRIIRYRQGYEFFFNESDSGSEDRTIAARANNEELHQFACSFDGALWRFCGAPPEEVEASSMSFGGYLRSVVLSRFTSLILFS